MTDDELIKWLVKRLDMTVTLPHTEQQRLIALARRGAAVKWMPIEEAPRDGRFVVAREPSGHIHPLQFCVDGYWRGSLLDVPHSWNPTHFIPLSSLGEPET